MAFGTYEEASLFKKVRARRFAVPAPSYILMNDECVVLLGPPMSEKSYLLADVVDALQQGGRFRPLRVDGGARDRTTKPPSSPAWRD